MTFQSLHTFVFVFASLMTGQTALAQSEGTDTEAVKIFAYGESCAQLGQLSRVELVGITHSAYAEQFALFCKPDSVYRCDDYNAYVAGLGSLEDNGMSCRYLPGK
jgi:hypothetical protein